MKYKYSDGYIEIREQGNTFIGDIAHQIMHIAENVARESGKDFQYCLKVTCEQVKRMIVLANQ